MIEVSNLSYTYINRNESANSKIDFPEIQIGKGEHCLLLGNSGSGKTTLLHLLGGLLRSQAGKIEINGIDIGLLSETNLDHFRGKKLGFIFQRNHLISALTVKMNLLLAPYLADERQNENRIDEVLTQLDLIGKKNAKIRELSQGQAQRVAIARAIINKPSVILADEPTSALDDKNCDNAIELLIQVANQNNSTLIIATHDQRLKNRIRKAIILKSTPIPIITNFYQP